MTKKYKPRGIPKDISEAGINIPQTAFKSKNYQQEHQFTDEEIKDRKDEHYDTVKMISNRAALMSDFSKLIKDGFGKEAAIQNLNAEDHGDLGDESIKDLNLKLGRLQNEIDSGIYFETIELYGFAFHDSGHMAFYDKDGVLVEWRDLHDDEHQADAFGSWMSVANMEGQADEE